MNHLEQQQIHPRNGVSNTPPDQRALLTADPIHPERANVATDPALISNGYKVLKSLAEGTSGEVFLAENVTAGRPQFVAIKSVRTDLHGHERVADHMRLFGQEAKILSSITLPGVPRFYDFIEGELESSGEKLRYLIMEALIDAPDTTPELMTRAQCLKGLMPSEEAYSDISTWQQSSHRALYALRDAAATMGEIHNLGIVHADLKSADILCAPGNVTKVTDFGQAFSLTDPALPRPTFQDKIGGSYYYSSPERWIRDFDQRADVYALSVILYQVLTHTFPHVSEVREPSASAIMLARTRTPPRSPASYYDWLPTDLVNCCMRGLAMEPRERHANAREFAQELASALS